MAYTRFSAELFVSSPGKGTPPCQAHSPHAALSSHQSLCDRRSKKSVVALPRTRWCNARVWSCCSTMSPAWGMPKPDDTWVSRHDRYAGGGSAGPQATSLSRMCRAGAASPPFPPADQALVKAIACETVAETGLPLSRQSLADLTRRSRSALGKPISRSTVWRILHSDAIKPWQYDYWIFPRDPHFADKAGRVLDLYVGWWDGKTLTDRDFIISSDEKTSIQARVRCHPELRPAIHRRRRIEFEYDRGGALQYLAAWDVRRGLVMGRCEPTTGIEPFGRLVSQVMEQEPYASAEHVFWVVDNGSSHRGEISVQRMSEAHPNAVLVHTPVHASWLNQVEIYFSLVQRKVLTPNDFADLHEIEIRLRLYEELTNQQPRPFSWKFDRKKLTEFLRRLRKNERLPDQIGKTKAES
jgi:hypothetical protein